MEKKKTITSPLPKKKKNEVDKTMSFYDALREVVRGKRVCRKGWQDPRWNVRILDERLMILDPEKDGKYHSWTIKEGDMISDDWVVV